MSVYKVNVSLPQDLVAEIDAAATEAGVSRSGFIAEASARYLADLELNSAEEVRRGDIDKAMERMRALGKKIPRDFDYMSAIREARERHGWDGPE